MVRRHDAQTADQLIGRHRDHSIPCRLSISQHGRGARNRQLVCSHPRSERPKPEWGESRRPRAQGDRQSVHSIGYSIRDQVTDKNRIGQGVRFEGIDLCCRKTLRAPKRVYTNIRPNIPNHLPIADTVFHPGEGFRLEKVESLPRLQRTRLQIEDNAVDGKRPGARCETNKSTPPDMVSAIAWQRQGGQTPDCMQKTTKRIAKPIGDAVFRLNRQHWGRSPRFL